MSTRPRFADRLLQWWKVHGRHDLPWQQQRTPYRVWVAEIMLQQTRVETVIPYFRRFMQAFPDLASLARAHPDRVLAAWSGLGYYARARNLHAAARRCMSDHDGQVPADAEALQALPGIGRSTAAAIRAQGFAIPATILDANARRVVARHAAVRGWFGRAAPARQMWQEAEARTPDHHPADYTQALMDLGSLVCTPSQPDCANCPVAADCRGRRAGLQAQLPEAAPRRKPPRRQQAFRVLRDGRGRVLLVRRPPAGIWGGLWCLPECDDSPGPGRRLAAPPPREHAFTHFRLEMTFDHRRISARRQAADLVREAEAAQWFARRDLAALGLPQPIRRVLMEVLEPGDM